MIGSILCIVIITGIIIWIEIPKLVKTSSYKEINTISFILIIGVSISIALVFKVKVPSPFDFIIYIYKPLSNFWNALLQ